MFVRVPVMYETVAVLKGRQKRERVTCGEWIDVHVVDVAEAEAPIATRYAAKRGEIDAPGGIHETRWFDGTHWEPVLYSVSGKPAVPRTASDLVEASLSGHHYGNPLGSSNKADLLVRGVVKPEAALEVRSIVASDREFAISNAHAVASNVMIVDGMAWERAAGEPIIKVTLSSGFRSYAWIEIVHTDHVEPEAAKGAFSALQWDDAVEYAISLKPDQPLNHEDLRIDVLVPESIRFDGETPAVMAALTDFLKWGKPDIASDSEKEIIGWVRFRDAFARAKSEPNDQNIERVIACFTEHRRTADVDVYTDWMDEQIEAALKRWNLRPLAIERYEPPRAALL